MSLRSPVLLAGVFLALAMTFSLYFNVAIRTDSHAATSHFENLLAMGAKHRAARQGERALRLRSELDQSDDKTSAMKAKIASLYLDLNKFERAADMMGDAIQSDWAKDQQDEQRITMEDTLARANILSGKLTAGVATYASFLDLAGDAASHSHDELFEDSTAELYAAKLAKAHALFRDKFVHTETGHSFQGDRSTLLATSNQLADLGSHYSLDADGGYVAAGLLRASYNIRKELLGADHPDTVQIAIILGRIFTSLERYDDTVSLYLEAFHAQEQIKGPNSPDLSLYIKLLADTYVAQGRITEAQALYEHMRRLFRDAFGDQRYAINRERDRREDVNRPVSQIFTLPAQYAPTDLVSAAEYSVPTGKTPHIDEMKLRLAPDVENAREANLPARLAQLMSLCASESGERISLRSGYRSYSTQTVLFKRNGNRGTVTPPGMSEHQTGLAADINVNGRFMRQSDRTFQCFEENGFRFGFILSYPPGNEYLPGQNTYEPWHWRYVGVQTAQLYREAGPLNRPQEFLAALPCYQERAEANLFPNADEPDLCLTGPEKIAISAKTESVPQPEGEIGNPARILNTVSTADANR